MDLIKINQLKKYYGTSRGVEDVSFSVKAGEIVGFVGPNGAGKSTVIRTLMGLIAKTSGTATIFGYETFLDSSQINHDVGYVPSEVILYRNLTAFEQLKFFADIRNVSEEKILQLADYLELDLEKRIAELSLGNKKKVGIIQALMHEPRVIILDEPTSGLDPLIQKKVFKLLDAARNQGAAILLSSHVLREVEKICDRVIIIKEGKIIYSSQIDVLKQQSAKLITISPHLDLEILDCKLHSKTKTSTTYLFNGDINDLISNLSNYNITNLTITELDLDQLFLHYYERGDSNE